MKKIIIFLVLFILLLFFAIFLVINETQKRSNAATLLNNRNTEKESKINTEFFEGKVKSIPTQAPLYLTISSPRSNEAVDDTNILIKGMTVPQTLIMVNEFELTADTQGNFSKSLSLDEGENYINIVAYNSEGQVVEKELIVTRAVQE